MAVNINTNIASINSQRSMGKTQEVLHDYLAKAASGNRINSAKDDAAGLAIMNEMESQIRGLSRAEMNTMDGVSMVQTAEGGMAQMGDAMIRMRELAVQSGNGTLGDDERAAINEEFTALRAEVDRIAATTEFNGTKLMDGSAAGGISFQVGVNDSADDRISMEIDNMNTANMGSASAALSDQSLSTAEGALAAMGTIDAAIQDISAARANLGSTQNALTTKANNLANMKEQTAAAKSRIGDADMADTSTKIAQNQILLKSSLSVVAQANQVPSIALSLIG